jgi:Zn-dependent peptidase ImmA (M78 family)
MIIIAQDLTSLQERSTVAHHLEHALAGDETGCGTGPYADAARGGFSLATILQDRRADRRAARKLLPATALRETPTGMELADAAEHLAVTEHMLRVRMADLSGEGSLWLPATSKIAG